MATGCKAEDKMKVSYKRTGGFAPIPVSCSLDTDTCSTEEAQELKRLVAVSGIMMASSMKSPIARDVRLHTLNIDDNGTIKEVSWDDVSIPAEARPLVQFMQERARTIFGDED